MSNLLIGRILKGQDWVDQVIKSKRGEVVQSHQQLSINLHQMKIPTSNVHPIFC